MSGLLEIYVRDFTPVPGIPEIHIYSITSETISISWAVSDDTVVDRYEVQWEVNHEQLITFHLSFTPTSFNNHTIDGLEEYGTSTVSISVTAFNAAGSRTSPSVNVAADSVMTQNRDSPDSDDVVIIGAVVGGCALLVIAAVIVALLIYHCKWKSRKEKDVAKFEHT